MKNMASGTALVLCIFAVSGCGCGKRETVSERMSRSIAEKVMEKAIEKDGGGRASVDIKNNKITVKTDKGDMSFTAGDGASLPKDFPADVYVDKNAKIQAVINTGEGISVSMLSKSPVSEAAASYQKQMTDKGWKQDTQMTMQDQVYTAFKKDKRQIMVTIAKTGDETTIGLVLSKKDAADSTSEE